jgi:hypothetical protein
MIDFISNTYHFLKSTKYPSAYFALGGDINDMKVELLNVSPLFKQIVILATISQSIVIIQD